MYKSPTLAIRFFNWQDGSVTRAGARHAEPFSVQAGVEALTPPMAPALVGADELGQGLILTSQVVTVPHWVSDCQTKRKFLPLALAAGDSHAISFQLPNFFLVGF